MTDTVCKRCLVSGRVQGVFYRVSTADRAYALGVTGRVRNLTDGRVEVIACGKAAAVAEFCQWLSVGPPAARVSKVSCEEVDANELGGQQAGFTTV